MPANTAMPMFVRQKYTCGNMAESKLYCATLLRNKYAIILRIISYGKTCQNCQDFYSIFLDIFLAQTTGQAKIEISLAINLVRTS